MSILFAITVQPNTFAKILRYGFFDGPKSRLAHPFWIALKFMTANGAWNVIL